MTVKNKTIKNTFDTEIHFIHDWKRKSCLIRKRFDISVWTGFHGRPNTGLQIGCPRIGKLSRRNRQQQENKTDTF